VAVKAGFSTKPWSEKIIKRVLGGSLPQPKEQVNFQTANHIGKEVGERPFL